MVTQSEAHRNAQKVLEAIKKNAEATEPPPKEKKGKEKAVGSTPGSTDGGGSGGKSPGTATGGGDGGSSRNRELWGNPQILIPVLVMLLGALATVLGGAWSFHLVDSE